MKAVLFATGTVSHAASEAEKLSRRYPAGSVRLVAPAPLAAELAAVTALQILPYRAASLPALLLRLWLFLGFARAEIICLSGDHCWRLLKLSACLLRWRVAFARPGQEAARLGLGAFLWISISRLWARENRVLLVGSAGPQTLARIREDLARRRPGAEIEVLESLGPAKFARLSLHWRRYRYLSIPWTREGHNLRKLGAWLLPCGRREIYNEHGDSFSVRLLGVLLLHIWRRFTDPPKAILLVGSAGPQTLARVENDLRRRYPEAPLYILPKLGFREFCRVAFWRFRLVSIPWTREGHNLRKLAALLFLSGRRDVYNEHGDFYSFRRVDVLLVHLWRRFTDSLRRAGVLLLRIGHRFTDSVRNAIVLLRRAWRRSLDLPPGVTVLGSASGYYLKDIVADLRRRHPGERVHGVLPPRLAVRAGSLFDSVTVLQPLAPATWTALLRRTFGPERTGGYVIPCTNEGFYALKLLGWLLPLGRREIYNENHDGYALRSGSTLIRHFQWRLHHRLFYQALSERHGRPHYLHLVHLLLYPLRLLSGASLLMAVRLRAAWYRRTAAAPAPQPERPLVPAPSQPREVFDTAER